jgi:hypothetical protein
VAQHLQVRLIDDFDGESEAQQTVVRSPPFGTGPPDIRRKEQADTPPIGARSWWGDGCESSPENSLEGVGERLVAATNLLHASEPVAAYESLLARQPNHIKYLGPAFFTKYLYYAAGHPTAVIPQPLILDRFVARSVNRSFDGWALRDNGWSGATYSRYLLLAAAQAEAAGHGVGPSGIEMALYNERP